MTYYQSIVSTMNLVNIFSTETASMHYQQGTASQIVVLNILYKDFNLAFFSMLKAFDYIKDEEDIFVVRSERMDELYKSHKKNSNFRVAYIKVQELYDDLQDSFSIHPFLVPISGFFMYHNDEKTILFNDGKIMPSSGIIVNELRNINAVENEIGTYEVCEVGAFSEGNFFGRRDIATYKATHAIQHRFLSFDLMGKDSFGKKFGYIANPSSLDLLLEELLYLESLIKNVHDLHGVVKNKALPFSEEEMQEIVAFVNLVNPQISHALEYDLKSRLALPFIEAPSFNAHEASSSSSQSVSAFEASRQKGLDVLADCQERLEQAANHYKKIAFDHYEKQIIAEQEKRKAAVVSGKIYEEKKKSSGRGRSKQTQGSKKADKKSVGFLSKKEKEAFSAQALAFLEENKVKASIKKRELDLLARQMMKALDPEKVVEINSNVDGSHEIFHAEGAESVTRAGHGNNPEFSASVANEFLMNRARQIETSKRFMRLKKKLEAKS